MNHDRAKHGRPKTSATARSDAGTIGCWGLPLLDGLGTHVAPSTRSVGGARLYFILFYFLLLDALSLFSTIGTWLTRRCCPGESRQPGTETRRTEMAILGHYGSMLKWPVAAVGEWSNLLLKKLFVIGPGGPIERYCGFPLLEVLANWGPASLIWETESVTCRICATPNDGRGLALINLPPAPLPR